MAKEDNLNPAWKKGESGNPSGRPKGSKNRSTIAKYWLNIEQKTKNPLTSEVETMSQEDSITLAQIKKAKDGDVSSYKALMDSSYGAPIQQIEQTQENYDFTNLTKEEVKEILKENGEHEE
tara:strand:+ start:3261 stop:3623 length:363 start_codon:yes stop_codon:yes gene_type:complete